ncbi:hypothetical protein PHLGIDRAFT_257761 [Phlebiopsis gigantea 11061_1 CR5-6]|uniref:Prephenate dehydratase domain-containing protein n=1 Tax=Phlebiopsis gigantea (strain 11061_1 CR5-6) TaxID=745531 RepID=A0A0C3S7G8_PHLG1|nr:hypothetical protein PHLGIDRAFT_257761 [Phlebiopsis gigantea 11061_1 CR5-6]
MAKHFPNVTLEKKTSTAAAARSLFDDDDLGMRSAAICSTICEKVIDGLEILQRSVQDSKSESTPHCRPRLYVNGCSQLITPVSTSSHMDSTPGCPWSTSDPSFAAPWFGCRSPRRRPRTCRPPRKHQRQRNPRTVALCIW